MPGGRQPLRDCGLHHGQRLAAVCRTPARPAPGGGVTDNGTPRYLLYIRQSLNRFGDDSLSLAFQERSLRELVERKGGAVIEPPIVDSDEKGNDPNRPGIAELTERTKQEKPDAIGVFAVSRFAR